MLLIIQDGGIVEHIWL